MKQTATRTPLRAPKVLSVFSMLFLSCALMLSVTIGHSEDRGMTRVRILAPQTTAVLPLLAMAKENALPGVTLQVDFFINHAQALALLMRGETDLLLSGTSQGWENRLDGSSIVMINTGVWALSSLVGRDPSLKGFADLRGKRLALPFPGAPLDFQSRALFAFEKIDPDKDLTISYGPFAQSVQRLLAGQLDAVALPEPLVTTMVKKNGLLRIVEYSAAWARLTGGDAQSPQVSLFATEGFTQEHAEMLKALVGAWDAASRKLTANPAEAAAQFSAVLQTDPAILEEASRHTLFAVPATTENKSRVLAYYQTVARYLPAGPRPLDERFFFTP
jgi:NitT/TauT family transport system substrate-binding protein